MGKSKKSKGKKGKGKKGKKKDKKPKEPEEPPPPPELNTFVNVRRKNLTLCLETFEEQQIKELKVQVATILRQFPEDIQLWAMTGKKEEEMLEKEKPKKEEKKKEDKSRSRGGGRDKKEEKKEKREEPKPPADMTLSGYGYTAATSTIFKPLTIGLTYRGDDAEFEKLEITPYGEFPVIPESIKMHLRNYEPPPPPPAKKGNNNNKGNNNKGKTK